MNLHRNALTLAIMIWSATGFAGSIETSPRMKVGRYGAQATTLSSGKVLITGGNSYHSSSYPDAEIWDPATKTFTAVAALMAHPRAGHTAILLNDGTVFLFGGSYASPGAEIFDPAAQSFTAVSTAALPPTQSYHTATKLTDGRILIVFAGSAAGIYDPVANTFTATANAPQYRYDSFTATLLCDGSVLLAGSGTRTAEIFSPSTGAFTPITMPMLQSRSYHTATRLSCSEVLFIGGTYQYPPTSEIYNTASQTFTSVTGPNSQRSGHVAALLDSGDVLVVGGGGYGIELFGAATRTFVTENLAFYSSLLYQRGIAVALYQSAGNCSSCSAGHKVLMAGGGSTCDGSIYASNETLVYVPTNMSAPPPSISSVTPATAWTGGGTTVTITGANFQQGATAAGLSVTSTTATQIVGTTHASDAQAATITVTNPDAQAASLANSFSYVFKPAGDANGDAAVTVGDVFYLINHLFAGGPPARNYSMPAASLALRSALPTLLSLGKPVQRGLREYAIPVYVSGAREELTTLALQFRVGDAARVRVVRAGATAALTPVFEATPRGRGSVGYISSFAQSFVPGQQRFLVAEVLLTASTGERLTVSVDPANTALATAQSAVRTHANGGLTVASGSVELIAETTCATCTHRNKPLP